MSYDATAELYDLIYAFKPYAKEAEQIREKLNTLGVADGARVLEGACGTGGHLIPLAKHFDVEGFDAAARMLGVAKRKAPGLRWREASLTDFAVEQPVDAFLLLFGSVGYLLDPDALDACARRVADALRPGGVVLVEPWMQPADIDVGKPMMQWVDRPDLKIVRTTVLFTEATPDGRTITAADMHWLVARRGRRVTHYQEVDRLWSAPPDTLVAAFERAGLETTFEPGGYVGRGLVVGRKR